MKRYLAVFLIIGLMPLSNLWSQTINVSVTDWLNLRTTLQISRELLDSSNLEVLNLQESLRRAIESKETSGTKIKDLEDSLAKAKAVQKQLQTYITSLEAQLIELGKSLSDTRSELAKISEKHLTAIKDLVDDYDAKMKLDKLLLKGAIIIILVETVYIAISNLP